MTVWGSPIVNLSAPNPVGHVTVKPVPVDLRKLERRLAFTRDLSALGLLIMVPIYLLRLSLLLDGSYGVLVCFPARFGCAMETTLLGGVLILVAAVNLFITGHNFAPSLQRNGLKRIDDLAFVAMTFMLIGIFTGLLAPRPEFVGMVGVLLEEAFVLGIFLGLLLLRQTIQEIKVEVENVGK